MINVLVIYSVSNPVFEADVEAKLADTDITVTGFDAEYAAPPTAAQLASYDAVLVYTDHDLADAELTGDLLADYIDGGGGVVQAVFANGYVSVEGRWAREEYEALSGADELSWLRLSLVPLDSASPLLQDVVTFDGGESSWYIPDAAPTTGATVVAEWNNGVPLVAWKGRVVDLNFFPPSADAQSDLWVGDGAALLRNAVRFVADVDEVETGDTGVGDDDDDDDGSGSCPPWWWRPHHWGCQTSPSGFGWFGLALAVGLARRRGSV